MDFKSKIGPLAVWQWGVVVGGIAVLFMWRSWQGGSGSVVEGIEYSDYDSEAGLKRWATQYEQMSGQVTASPNVGGDSADSESGSGTTNITWLAQGVKYAIEAGNSPVRSQIALQKYLDGGALDSDDQRIVNAVIARLGTPPDGTFGTPTLAQPAPKSAPTPAPTPTKEDSAAAKKRQDAINKISARIDAIKAERAKLQNERTKLKNQRNKSTNKATRSKLLAEINRLAGIRAQLLTELRALQTQRAVLRAL